MRSHDFKLFFHAVAGSESVFVLVAHREHQELKCQRVCFLRLVSWWRTVSWWRCRKALGNYVTSSSSQTWCSVLRWRRHRRGQSIRLFFFYLCAESSDRKREMFSKKKKKKREWRWCSLCICLMSSYTNNPILVVKKNIPHLLLLRWSYQKAKTKP